MHRNFYMEIQQSLADLTEGEGDTYFNLILLILNNSLRFQLLALSLCTYSPAPRSLCMFPGGRM